MTLIIVRVRGVDDKTWLKLKVFCTQRKEHMGAVLIRLINEGLPRLDPITEADLVKGFKGVDWDKERAIRIEEMARNGAKEKKDANPQGDS